MISPTNLMLLVQHLYTLQNLSYKNKVMSILFLHIDNLKNISCSYSSVVPEVWSNQKNVATSEIYKNVFFFPIKDIIRTKMAL